jgi:arylsulfatase A-like enzyme
MAKRRLLLLGWDAADWKVIQPLVDAGQMPNLARLLERGVMGNHASLQPMLSPMLWTSIATGKRPSKHGVHGFSEVDGTFLAHLESAGWARVLDLHYQDALDDPATAAEKLRDLLGEGFDAVAATAAIDRSLHRTRSHR